MLTAAAIVAGICAAISAIAGDRGGIADLSATTEKKPAVIVTTPAESTQTPEPTAAPARYPLSASERDTVERVVMAEAGGECYEGQVLVAQCILNAAEKLDQRPPEVFETLSYANAGLKIINPDMDAVERRLRGLEEQPKPAPQRRARTKRSSSSAFDDW